MSRNRLENAAQELVNYYLDGDGQGDGLNWQTLDDLVSNLHDALAEAVTL